MSADTNILLKKNSHLFFGYFWLILVFLVNIVSYAQGPAGIGSSTENVLWLRADEGTSTTTEGEKIHQWLDKSGNNNHANQTDSDKQPLFVESSINGLPGIEFSGTDVNFVVDGNDKLDNSSGLTIFVVGQPEDIDNAPRGLISKRVNSSTQRAYSLFIGYTNTTVYFDTPQRLNGNNNAVTNDPQIFSAVFTGEVANPRSRVFLNSTASGTNNTSNTSIAETNSDLFIGILNDNYGNAFRGEMSEVIIYREGLNFVERTIVEAYLANRYNINLSSTSYSSTTHTQGFIGIGHHDGEKYSSTQNVGSGLLLSELNNTLDEDNEFVFAGHDGTAHSFDNSDLPNIPDVELDERWQRIYYIERVQDEVVDAGNTDVRITFDFDESGLSLSDNRVYYLLYRSGTSGEFSQVSGGTGVADNNKVSVNVSSENFQSGYYTIVRSDQEVRTWYSHNSLDWNNFNTWSLTEGSPDNPDEEIPGILDRVIIRNNQTVTVTQNNTTCGILEVRDGTVNFGSTAGNNFSSITGQSNGRIRLEADNFPSGDASGFADPASGGTVIYAGNGYELNSSRTFRNMIVELQNTNDEIELRANYTLNGNLLINRGTLVFRNNASDNSSNLTVFENVEVLTQGIIRTAAEDSRHQLNLYGDFTNEGDVQFTNRESAIYGSEADNGIVDVNFLSPTRNQNMLLDGPSRFYRIAIEKGFSSTYELFMEASDASYFELFGFANEGHPQNEQLAKNNNALGLTYGTVRIGNNITIERLNGGGNYNVSENAILWVDGGSVSKPTGTGEAVVVYGKVVVSDGEFISDAPSGITTRYNGVFEALGGTTRLRQFRTSVYGVQHIGGYIQKGGDVLIDGHNANGNYYSFTLSYEGNVFELTGGTLTVRGTNNRGAMFINSDPVNQNVSATANLIIDATSNSVFRISSKSPFPNVTMRNSNGGARTVILEGGIVGTGAANQAQLPALPFITKGNFIIEEDITFDPKGQDVTIGRNYSISNGANYIAASNTTTFQGTNQNYGIDINGGATNYFHNLTINNPGFTGSLQTSHITIGNNLTITAGTLATGTRVATVRGDIINSGTITSGTGKVLITDRGRVHSIELTNGGSYASVPDVTIDAPADGTQATAVAIFNGTPTAANPLPINKIVITNTGSGYTSAPDVNFSSGDADATAVIGTTHVLGGNGNGVFGNLEIDEEHPDESGGMVEVTYLTAKQTVTGTMTLTDGILDLKTLNLYIEGELSTEDENDYSETNLIRTAGNHSDAGLTRRITANETYLYPTGTVKTSTNTNRYTWAKPTFSNIQDEGKVTIVGVPNKLPYLNTPTTPANNRYLEYYWRVKHSDFTDLPDVHNRFNSYSNPGDGDYNWNSDHGNYMIGKIVGNERFNEEDHGLGTLEDEDSNRRLLNFSSITQLEQGEFTAGWKQVFSGSIRVYYLYQNGNWNSAATWSTTRGESTNIHNSYPQGGDVAVIRRTSDSYSGIVNVTQEETSGRVEFDSEHPWHSGSPRIIFTNDDSFNSNFYVVEVADTHEGGLDGINDGERHGAVIQYNLSTTYAGQFPNGDFGDFYQYPNALVIYQQSGTAGTRNLSKFGTEYPQLWFQTQNSTYILPDTNVTVHGRVILPYNIQLHINDGTYGDLLVKKRLDIGHAGAAFGPGQLVFPGTAATDKTVTVLGGINLFRHASHAQSHIRINNAEEGGRSHRLIAHSNITLSDDCHIDLGDGNPDNTNVELILTGESNSILSGTGSASVELSSIIMNKGNSQLYNFSFNWPFDLNGSTDGISSEKALQLQNGRLILNHSDIEIDLSTGGGVFFIPSTAGLVVREGKVNVKGDDTGILLDGLLRAESNGIIDMDDGTANGNNYIEYSASGAARLEIAGDAQLTVGSQIRRGTSNPSGVLRYIQTGGNVVVGKNAAPQSNRGVFEVLNTGSNFYHIAGDLTIMRAQDAANEATVLIDPSISITSDATLQIGNDDSPANSVITIKSNTEIGNLLVSGVNGVTAQLKDRSLTINRDLTIDAGCAFDGNSAFDLTVNRHIINNGETNLNVDTLHLTGTSTAPSSALQEITGDITVNHLKVEPETSVTLQESTNVEITGNLYINSGQFNDGGNTINVKGNVNNTAIHFSPESAGGLKFSGSSLQQLYGFGDFGRIEIDNNNGVRIENDISLTEDLTLTNGILEIQSNKLSLGLNTEILGGPFNEDKMIAVGGGDFIKGIQKTLPIVANGAPSDPYDENDPAYTYNFTFPIGISAGTVKKFTPVDFYVSSSASVGDVQVYPVNSKHITIDEPGMTDVLEYFWVINSNNLSNFTTLFHTHYDGEDIVGDSTQYIGARLFENFWAKYEESDDPPIEVVFEEDEYIAFVYSVSDNISGEYTAGIEPHIPDEVPLYISVQNGEFTDPDTWVRADAAPVPAGGPSGQRVQIEPGHTVTVSSNFRRAYRTTIHGRLELNTTLNHILGYVDGSGTLSSESGSLPAGNYEDFFEPGNGSTMEWGGTASYGLPSNILSYNNLTIKGSGEKTLPNLDFTVYGDLVMQDDVYVVLQNNLSVHGDLELRDNVYLLTASPRNIDFFGESFIKEENAIYFAEHNNRFRLFGSNPAHIFGDFFQTGNRFNNFYNYKVANTPIYLYGNVDIRFYILINSTNRIILAGDENVLLLSRSDPYNFIADGSTVEGRFQRRISEGSGALFISGKNGNPRYTTLNNVAHSGGIESWTVEYFDDPPPHPLDELNDEELVQISATEYWEITGPAGGEANVELNWGPESWDQDEIDDDLIEFYTVVAKWNGTEWKNKGNSGGATVNGDGTGSVSSDVLSGFSTRIFTLASNSADNPLPVEFLAFDAYLDGSHVLLEWATATERNNNFFTVERSRDGVNFEIVAVVASKADFGYSNQIINYSAVDYSPYEGRSYYRVKQTDFDGQYDHSNVVGVYYNRQGEIVINLYPNPNRGDEFNLALTGLDLYESVVISIVDIRGKTAHTEFVNADDNGRLMRRVRPNRKLEPGVYIVNVSAVSGRFTARMVVGG